MCSTLSSYFCLIKRLRSKATACFTMESIKEKRLFKSQRTEIAFNNWLTIGGGINSNTTDNERFYEFVQCYHDNGENLEKEIFVKACKNHTHTSNNTNRGICQEYYHRLEVICDFLKWKNLPL